MLPETTKDAILANIPTELWVEVGNVYPEYPDASEWQFTPVKRWAYEDFEESTAPFDHITLSLSQNGVIETQQPIDDEMAYTMLDDTVDADRVSLKGNFVYDVLTIMITAEGSETRNDFELTAGERAHLLCNAVYDHFVHRWQSSPLDHFDADGNSIEAPNRTYADELSPPLRIDEIPGRGPTRTTDLVDANGAQYNAAVELHYVDGVLEYEFTPTSGDSSVSLGN